MATKTFGIQPTLNNAYWGGVPYHANIGLRATMPERGKILSLSLKLARVNDSDVPIVWGAIWNRSNGTLLAQSNHTHSPTNTFTTPGNMGIYTFAFDQPQIEAGTLLWIGYGKRSNQSGRALYYGIHTSTSGSTIDRNDDSQSAPATTFTTDTTYSNHALWIEVTYKTGGQIKVWNGVSFVDKPLKSWSGSSWMEKTVKHYKDSSWVESN
ncbi:MAG: hypothetical protein CVU85_05770 [Firmicutes bacterium HGW-Firmicutes-10]|nr:MAG: hypothetical protein CVU85_05770 [Firmicutes bacterium HGW-Firmicutes-10]